MGNRTDEARSSPWLDAIVAAGKTAGRCQNAGLIAFLPRFAAVSRRIKVLPTATLKHSDRPCQSLTIISGYNVRRQVGTPLRVVKNF